MRRTTILNAVEVNRKTYKEAETAFLKHCKLKNLRKATLQYYEEDLKFFFEHVEVMYIDEAYDIPKRRNHHRLFVLF